MALTQIIDDTYIVVGNTSLLVANTNLLMKGGTFGYGLAITGAAAIDAFPAPTVPSKCLFGIGCVCGAAGLPALGIFGEAASGAFFWLGRKANQAVGF